MAAAEKAQLAGRVFVGGAWYGPGDDVPADVAVEITNPKAWVGGKVPDLDSEDTVVEIPEGDPAESWTNDQLKAYAAKHEIDLGDASKKAEYLAVIAAAAEQK